ncbi:MAG: HEAT repeat domain-containing protein [Candidatus Angelobacter sp.]
MKCDWSRENIVLLMYDELADDAKFELEHHIQNCADCRSEFEAALAFKQEMAALPMQEISPNFLAASRMQLQESLEQAQQHRSLFGGFIFDFAGWMQQIKLAPALTVALLMVGFAGGTLTSWRIMNSRQGTDAVAVPEISPAEASIAGVESIVPAADSSKVAITYDTLRPHTYVSTPDDPRVQELLLLAARNTRNSDVRLGSIGLLTSQPEDNEVREALVYALRYDKNPGVRLKALDGLKGYVKDDIHVRDAVVEALMHDANPGVRSEAIGLLDPVKADTSVREALQILATGDQNEYIRSQSRRYLQSTPNLD